MFSGLVVSMREVQQSSQASYTAKDTGPHIQDQPGPLGQAGDIPNSRGASLGGHALSTHLQTLNIQIVEYP